MVFHIDQSKNWSRSDGLYGYNVSLKQNVDPALKAYFSTEKAKCPIYNDAEFTANKNEYLPIPSKQISASGGNYTQNPGW